MKLSMVRTLSVYLVNCYPTSSLWISWVGAWGYVLKSQAARDLIDALDRVHGGGTFFDEGAKKADGQEPITVMARVIL